MKVEMCETPLWQNALIWTQIVFNCVVAYGNYRLARRNLKAAEVGRRIADSLRGSHVKN